MRGCELRVLAGTLVHSYDVDSTCRCKYERNSSLSKRLARMTEGIEGPIVILLECKKGMRV